MIKFEKKIVVTASAIEEEMVSVYGVERPEVPSLFWGYYYMNDCYKSLRIDEEANNHDYSYENEEDVKMRKLIRQHLRQCFPGVSRILVDVSW